MDAKALAGRLIDSQTRLKSIQEFIDGLLSAGINRKAIISTISLWSNLSDTSFATLIPHSGTYGYPDSFELTATFWKDKDDGWVEALHELKGETYVHVPRVLRELRARLEAIMQEELGIAGGVLNMKTIVDSSAQAALVAEELSKRSDDELPRLRWSVSRDVAGWAAMVVTHCWKR